MKIKNLLATLIILSVALMSGCKKNEYQATVGVCPLVVSTIPVNGAVDVPLNQVVSATFNEKMNPATITTSTFILVAGITKSGVKATTVVDGTIAYSGMTAFFTPSSPLTPNTTYTGTVTTGCHDLMGNALNTNYVWTFSTDAPPTVTTDPANNAVDVLLNKIIIATFSVPMDSLTLKTPASTFTVKQGTTLVPGRFTYTNNTATFTPTSPLSPFTTYTGTITTGAKNLLGTPLAADYVWNFKTIPQLTLSSNPLIGGTTTGGGTFAQGSSVTATAIPNAGYTFANWTDSVTVVSTSTSYQFNMAGNKTLVANFTITPYTVAVSSNPVIGGTTSGSGTFNSGATVAVTAVANAGYTFTNWTEGGIAVSTTAAYTFIIAKNRILVANFTVIPPTQFTVNLSSNPLIGGTTTGAGSFNSGTSVSVTATPSVGYTFTNWTEGSNIVSSSSNYTFTISANRTLVANFTVIPPSQFAVNLSSNPPAGGTTTGGGSFNSGASVSVAATPNVGHTFTNWTEGLIVVSSSSNYTFTIVGNRTLVANFTAIISNYTLNVTAVNGVVVKNPNQATYSSGANVVLTATPNTGYVFTSWSGDATGSANPLTVTMNSNKNITANFTAVVNAFTLNVTAVNGTVVKNPDQPTYNSGVGVQLTATANSGYTFTSWSGDAAGSANPLTVIMNSNKNITANFTLNAPVGPGDVVLGGAGNFEILTMSGISTTGVTSITGNIGVSPMAATGITGFGLIMDTNGQSSHTPIVTGSVYASDYAPPTPANLTVAVADMLTAFTTANNLVTPAPIVDLYAGDISGRTLPAGLYKWSTGVLITNAGVTLTGGANDTWVFQIAQDLTVNSSAIITLLGGAQAKNIFWVVSGQALLGTNVNFSGNILSKTLISLNTGATVTGRLLAQTAVTLNAATVIMP